MEQEQIIDNLLAEYIDHRNAIKDMIIDLENIREKIDTLLPESVDKRFRFYFEEKVKAITALFNSLLDMRKEIAKSVKDEIEIRRRMIKGDSLEDLEELLDVRKIAKRVRTFQDKKQKAEELFEEKKKDELEDSLNQVKTDIKETGENIIEKIQKEE